MILFEYDAYLFYGFFLPAITLLFAFVLLCMGLYRFSRKNNEELVTDWNKKICKFLPTLIVCAIFIFWAINTLQYTFLLPSEQAEDVLYITGTVTEIKNIQMPTRYVSSGNSFTDAALVSIDSMEQSLYFMSSKGLEIGNTLSIKYLPKSHIVLGYGSASDMGALIESGVGNSHKNWGNYLFVVGFLILFVALKIIFKNAERKKDFNHPAVPKGEIRYLSSRNKKFVWIGAGAILIGIIVCFAEKSIFNPFLTVGIIWMIIAIYEQKIPAMRYDENGVIFYNYFGKATRYSYSDVSVEIEYDGGDDGEPLQIVRIGFIRKYLGKQLSMRCDYDSKRYLGVKQFIAFYSKTTEQG